MNSGPPNNTRLLGVIVAGGASRRMGGKNKCLLPLAGTSILDHIIERLSPQVDRLIVNANVEKISENIEVVPDIIKDAGPLGGLYSALSFAKEHGYSKVITAPGDTPFIPHDFARRLMEHADQAVVIAKSAGRIHPVLALWDVSLLDELKASLNEGERKMRNWIAKYATEEVVWTADPDPFFNINTPEDLIRAEKMVA